MKDHESGERDIDALIGSNSTAYSFCIFLKTPLILLKIIHPAMYSRHNGRVLFLSPSTIHLSCDRQRSSVVGALALACKTILFT